MKYNGLLESSAIYLRTCEEADCSEEYVAWLNDVLVNQYLETRWSKQNLESIISFVNSILNRDDSYLFAIIAKDNKKHIGNIKIGPVHPHYQYADISYFIGNRDYWGKGIATQAISLVTAFGFDYLGLNRVQAGVFQNNFGSRKALEKAGFECEGNLKQQLLDVNGKRQGHLLYGKLKDSESDFAKSSFNK